MKSLIGLPSVLLVLCPVSCGAAIMRLTWTAQGVPGDDRYGVHSITVDGDGAVESYPRPFLSDAMEVRGGMFYFSELGSTNKPYRITRTNLREGSVTLLYEFSKRVSIGEFAITDNYIYASDSLSDKIWRTDLNGGNMETVFSQNPFTRPSPNSLAANGQKLFWSMNDSVAGGGSIWSMDHSNPGTPTLLLDGLNQPRHLSINSTSIFWYDSGTISSMDLDGTNRRTIASTGTRGMAVDEHFLYWGVDRGIMRYDIATGEIGQFMELHGTVHKLFLEEIPEPGAWMIAGGGAALMVIRRRRI
jgi:hypothetical protein